MLTFLFGFFSCIGLEILGAIGLLIWFIHTDSVRQEKARNVEWDKRKSISQNNPTDLK